MNHIDTFREVAVIVSTLAMLGCGEAGPKPKPAAPVSGEVKFEGKPVESGVVNFESSTTGVGGQAQVKAGEFKFSVPVPLGQYKVTVVPPPDPPPGPGPSPPPANPKDIPVKYRTPKTSDLTAEVKAGDNRFTFDLKP